MLARGACLVEGPEHCGACHTERNIFCFEKGYSAAGAGFLMGGDLNGWHALALRGAADTRSAGTDGWRFHPPREASDHRHPTD